MKKTIYEGHIGILWKRGKIVRELAAGRHRYSALRGERIEDFDARVVQFTSHAEEFATKDNLVVRCAPSVEYRIANPTKLLQRSADHTQQIRTTLVDALRIEISKQTLDDLLVAQEALHEAVAMTTKKKFETVGLELVSLSPLNLLIPRSLRQAFEAEVAARKRAAADLEEARGRTAVLRHLANAASLVERQPALLQLLMGQKAKHVQFQFMADENNTRSSKK